MYHRVVSLLLMPCVLLTPSAALAHAHGGNAPDGHGQRPHIHLTPHDHHHHGQDQLPEPLHDHDADAIYIAGVDLVIGQRATDDGLIDSLFPALAWEEIRTAPPEVVPSGESPWAHPPPGGASCPLHVRYLKLII
jgi:hypothetical protein